MKMSEQIEQLSTVNKIKMVSAILMSIAKDLMGHKMENHANKMIKASTIFNDSIKDIEVGIEKSTKINDLTFDDDEDVFKQKFSNPYLITELPATQPFPHLKHGEKFIAQWEKNKIYWEKKAVMDGNGRSWKDLYDEYQVQNQEKLDEDVLNSQATELKTTKRKSFKGVL